MCDTVGLQKWPKIQLMSLVFTHWDRKRRMKRHRLYHVFSSVPILFLKGLFTRLHLRPDKNRNHKDYVWDPIRTMALSFIPLFVLFHSNSFWKCCVIKEVDDPYDRPLLLYWWGTLTTSWLKGSQCSGHCGTPFTVYPGILPYICSGCAWYCSSVSFTWIGTEQQWAAISCTATTKRTAPW